MRALCSPMRTTTLATASWLTRSTVRQLTAILKCCKHLAWRRLTLISLVTWGHKLGCISIVRAAMLTPGVTLQSSSSYSPSDKLKASAKKWALQMTLWKPLRHALVRHSNSCQLTKGAKLISIWTTSWDRWVARNRRLSILGCRLKRLTTEKKTLKHLFLSNQNTLSVLRWKIKA